MDRRIKAILIDNGITDLNSIKIIGIKENLLEILKDGKNIKLNILKEPISKKIEVKEEKIFDLNDDDNIFDELDDEDIFEEGIEDFHVNLDDDFKIEIDKTPPITKSKNKKKINNSDDIIDLI